MWYSIVMFAVSLVVSYLTRPKPSFSEPDPSSIADFDIPTADESRPIPVIFGDVWISGANVVWYGDLDIDKIQEKVDTGWFSSKHITVGYKYSLGIHFVLGHGPMDALLEIRVGDQQVWPARDESLTRADLIPYFYHGPKVGVTEEQMLAAVPATITETTLHGPADNSGTFYIFAPSLFGGDKNEGGVLGQFSLMMGAADQAPNAYLTGHLDDVPAYRGVTSLIAEGCYIGTSPYLKPWKFRVRRLPGVAWYAATADIGGHANPAHIIRECLTDGHWGLGYPESQIDDAVFRAAADRLHADALAMSLQWTQQETCEAFIQRVLNHINGALMTDLSTGLWQLKLVRDDYDPEALPAFDESSVISLDSYQRPGWSDVVNQVAVTYRDHAAGKDATVSVSNLGTIQVQGQIVPTTRDYRGFPTADLALRAASRDLRTISTPLARIQLTMDRRAWHLGIADVFRLTWPDLGLEHIVFRVIEATTGTLTDGRIRVRAVQDVFTLPSGGYTAQQPTGWVDPVHAPAPAPYRNLAEATYRQIINEIVGAEQWAQIDATAGFLTVQAARPSRDTFDYSLAARVDTDPFETTDEQAFTPTALLAADVGYLDDTITLSEIDDIQAIDTPCITYLGAELIRVTAITDTSATVERGLLDTVPTPHAAGERLWFIGAGQGVDDTTAWADDDPVDVRVLPRTPKGELALADATTDTLTMAHRAIRPFAPGRVRVNGQAYPQQVSGPLAITWAHRDRTAEIDTLASEASGNIGPEPGTTYRVTITDDNGAVLTERQDIAGTLFQDDPAADGAAAGHIHLRLEAERDGLQSWQAHELAVHRIGWTFSWDLRWGDNNATYIDPNANAQATYIPDVIAYVHGEYVAAGQNASGSEWEYFTSPDGTTWTRHVKTGYANYIPDRPLYHDGIWYGHLSGTAAFGTTGTGELFDDWTYTSVTNFPKRNVSGGFEFHGLRYVNGQFIALSFIDVGLASVRGPLIITSADCLAWTEVDVSNLGPTIGIVEIFHDGTRYIAVCNQRLPTGQSLPGGGPGVKGNILIYTSTDLITFALARDVTNNIVGDNATISKTALKDETEILALCNYGPNTGRSDYFLLHSSDRGLHWTMTDMPSGWNDFGAIFGPWFDGDQWVVYHGGDFATSSDAHSWTVHAPHIAPGPPADSPYPPGYDPRPVLSVMGKPGAAKVLKLGNAPGTSLPSEAFGRPKLLRTPNYDQFDVIVEQ